MKTLVYAASLCLFLVLGALAQQKPAKPLKTPAKKTTGVSPVKKTTKPVTVKKSAATAEPTSAPVEKSESSDKTKVSSSTDETNLKKLEAENQAKMARDGEQVTFYGMDRNSITVLPVQLYVPGLGVTDEKTGKPIYTPNQLYKASTLKNHAGDVLVSEKYFYNKIQFNALKMFDDLLKDSLNFYALNKLSPTSKLAREASKKSTPMSQKIGEYLTNTNVGTDILKIWTNRSILMNRIYYSQAEAEKRQGVDPKKLAVFEKLLRKNYVLVLALINPDKKTKRSNYGTEITTYSATIEGFLYRVDTTALDANNIQNKHPLQFVKQISMTNKDCDPKSEELVEILGGGTLESFKATVSKLMSNTIREQADYFYKSKSYVCAKNYYEYLLKADSKANQALKDRIEECNKMMAKTKLKNDDKTCLVTEESAFEDWIYAQSASNEVMIDLETQLEDLMVKSFVYKTAPYITSEIGKKQGLYTDQRFLVYRKSLINGKPGKKRIGTLRVIKVADNTDKFKEFAKTTSTKTASTMLTSIRSSFAADTAKKSAQSNGSTKSKPITAAPSAKELKQKALDSLKQIDLKTMSIFKQVDGERIEEKDLLVQNNDSGLGIQLGYGSRLGAMGLVLGADYRLAALVGSRMPLSGIKIGVNIGFPDETKVYEKYRIPKDKSSVIDLYLARELYLSPKYDLKPMIGVSAFNDKYHLMIGTGAYINVLGKSSNTKVKLAPDISYVVGYTIHYSACIRVEF